MRFIEWMPSDIYVLDNIIPIKLTWHAKARVNTEFN